MKKSIILFLVFILALVMAACGGSDESLETNQENESGGAGQTNEVKQEEN